MNPWSAIVEQVTRHLLGKEHQVKLALSCFLAQGHLLVEDLPGMGKTTLSHTLAATLGLDYRRIQFTSDLLPGDITGVNIFNQAKQAFELHPGPIFAQLILADELNRATPKCQSALLEAMEEHQVTIEGKTWKLPQPFFVIATQNPKEQHGTYPLPESQLDRFMMRMSLGYPEPAAERQMLLGHRPDLASLRQLDWSTTTLEEHRARVTRIHASERLLDYIQALLLASRSSAFSTGLSPRAGIALIRAAKGWAYVEGRDHVLPEDVQTVLGPVVDHRLHNDSGQRPSEFLLSRVAVV